MAEVQIQSVSHRHDAIIDWLLANPGVKNLNQLCAELGYTRSWLSVVMRSDVFREEYTRRRQDMNSELSRQICEKQLAVTLKALDRIDTMLDDPEQYDLRTALDVADRTAKALGFSSAPGGRPVVSETHERVVRTVDQGLLREARETITRVTHESD